MTPLLLQPKSTNPESAVYVGVVVDNNDPTKRQRIRVSIPKLLEADSVDDLPWINNPIVSLFGVGDNYTSVRIPRIGSRVLVTFSQGDLNFGSYLADSASGDHVLPEELASGYPNRLGSVAPNGDVLYTDLETGDILFKRASGTCLKIDIDGNVTITCSGNWTEYIKGNFTRVVEGNYEGTIKGNSRESVSGSGSLTIGGSSSSSVGGSLTEVISGTATRSASSTALTGDLDVTGDVKALDISLLGHKHAGVTGGTDPTQNPIP